MTAAEDAYREAERMIAEAKASEAEELVFQSGIVRALDRLPPQIATLGRLRLLDLDNTQVRDLRPIARLTGLTALFLTNTKVVDLTPVAGLTALAVLFVDNTGVSELSPLARLTGLSDLSFGNTSVSDLSPIRGLTNLHGLWLEHTRVSDLRPIGGLTALRRLTLQGTPVNDISPLASLSELSELLLHNTSISDLSPLANLTGLVELSLDGTEVGDLRPISAFALLADSEAVSETGGLSFYGCLATRLDRRIGEISDIKNNARRARLLFDYLTDWEPPVPEPDPLVPVTVDGGRLEIVASVPTEAERDERLKRVLHERLRDKAQALAAAAGNRFPRLAGRARAVVLQVDRPFEELDLLVLHLELDDLRERQAAGREDGDPFDEEVTGPLGDVLRQGPGLTMDHPDVELLEERRRRHADGPPDPGEVETHGKLSVATSLAVETMGDRLRAMEARLAERPGSPASIEVQKAVHRNLLWKIGAIAGTVALDVVSRSASGAGVDLLKPAITGFLTANWPVVAQVAAHYGGAFEVWFLSAVSHWPEIAPMVTRWRRQRPGSEEEAD